MFRRVPSREVMRRAGAETARVAARMLANDRSRRVLAAAGPGNNGGDALIAAAILRAAGWPVAAVFGGDAARLSGDAQGALREWRDGGGELLDDIPEGGFDLALDGIFGVGLTREISGRYAEWINRLNAADCKVLAIDTPSGLNADTGAAGAAVIRADATVTFLARKPGLYTGDGPDCCGEVCFASLRSPPPDEADSPFGDADISPDWDSGLAEPSGFLIERLRDAGRLRPERTAHKGRRGALVLIGGSRGMEGALTLAARAAAGLGTGKVYAVSLSPRGWPHDLLSPDVMWPEDIPESATAIGIGPGLGKSEEAKSVLRKVLAKPIPLLADADALNLIAEDGALRELTRARAAASVVTPHPAEAGRLLGCGVAEVQADRMAAARELSEALNADVVLKGAGSVLHFADGGWGINGSGNPGLARAGAGDVLSGFISAFLAQTGDAARALETGVFLHGAAADGLAEKYGGIFGWSLDELTAEAGRILNRAAGGFFSGR